jgi:uncharacterized protein YyaL (SSP411 family)
MNRLSRATSPYLLQHQTNPVEWWEWGPDAFAEAQRTNRPVLLSVGYAACHWCHVMAHESFENPEIAAVMNELFVNIKVDREERPDVDHIYMSALHLLGERGGWPLTMFLDGEGKPFWGGTYFPPEPRFGRAGFPQILRSISDIYQKEPERIRQNTGALTSHLQAQGPEEGRAGEFTPELFDRVGQQIAGAIDPVHGGLRGAPKFPNPPILEHLARYARRTGDARAMELFSLTLDRMAQGGIHDHLGGGFARYSVDERWLVPHFEKMLYDNAQLLELYAIGAVSGSTEARRAAEGIVAWLTREMTLPEGGFASSLDADSEGEEGKFYVWSLAEVREVLHTNADAFGAAYDITPEGNFEGHNIPNRLGKPPLTPEQDALLNVSREKLLAQRGGRVRPGLDDKVLADWNGLMIGALVRAATILDRPDWIEIAARAFAFVSTVMADGDGLAHSWRAGSMVAPGFALDHAAMMRAALALHEATGEALYLDRAQTWRDRLNSDYRYPQTGRLAMTSARAEPLLTRPAPTHDDAVPNANGVFCEALARLAQITGNTEDHAAAEAQLGACLPAALASPLAHTSILNAFDLHWRGLAITIVNDESTALTKAALAWPYLDRSVARHADPATLPQSHPAASLAAGTTGPAALVCAGMRCSLPVSDPAALAETAEEMLRANVSGPTSP